MGSSIVKIALMMVGQGAAMAAAMISVAFAVLVGARLAPDPALATLPQGLALTATAVSTAPLSLFMGRYGRRAGFMLGAAIGIAAAAVAFGAIMIGSFWLFSFGVVLLGVYSASGQYYRFAASEVVPDAYAARAIAAVLVGGILAALTVPALTRFANESLAEVPMGGAFIAAGGYALIGLLLPLLIRFAPAEPAAKINVTVESAAPRPAPRADSRPLWKRPAFIAGAVTAAGGYGAMSLMMTATPLAMAHAGHTSHQSTEVIQAHVIAMYIPSLFSGWLIARFGSGRIIAAGLIAMAGTIAATRVGLGVGHFTLALILLGLGWNFLFVAGTAIVTTSYTSAERSRAQALNEVFVFGSAATAALAAGAVLDAVGWTGLTASASVILALIAGANLVRVVARRRKKASRAPAE